MKKILTISVVGCLMAACFSASAQYDTILNFNGTNNGSSPKGSLILIGNELFGMASGGGANADGNIFSIKENGTRDNPCFSFAGANGNQPYAALTYSGAGHTVYGMTYAGGATGFGCIFSVDTNGGNYKDIHDFSAPASTNGANPEGSLILSGHKLFGMTYGGGMHSLGNIFSIDTNGGAYADLYDFSNASGGYDPAGTLLMDGNRLYGMTQFGGVNGQGTIFSIDTNGTRFVDRWDFNAIVHTNGANPTGSLIMINHTLFGMTLAGGLTSSGNIFKIDTAGSRYTNLWSFDAGGDTNGSSPVADLVLKGHVLFGMTSLGGANSSGNIFRIDTDGTRYHNLWSFTNTNGKIPLANLTLSSNELYGMTSQGGQHADGVVFVDTLITVTTTDTNVSCNGANDGHAFAYFHGGISPYTYAWTSGSTTAKATGLSNGSYTVTVTDNDGFATTASITITQPTVLAITMASHTNEFCNGNATANAIANAATGGTAPYTYAWTPSGGTTVTAIGLSIGTYTITVTDKHGCTATASATITQPPALSAVISMVQDDGSTDGQASVVVSGGTGPYTYLWSPNGQITATITGQHAPIHVCCTITDANNCSIDSCISISSDAGINNISNSSLVQVYPDPTNGHFTIAGTTAGQIVEIYDYTGKKISTVVAGYTTTIQFNIADKANGIYLLKVQNKDGSLAGERKIVKTQ